MSKEFIVAKMQFPVETEIALDSEGEVKISQGIAKGHRGPWGDTINGRTIVLTSSVAKELYEKLSERYRGKLTGVQIKAVHHIDQMRAMLSNRLRPLLLEIATKPSERVIELLRIASDPEWDCGANDDDPTADDILKVVMSAAMLCYTEFIERGLVEGNLPPETE